MISGDLLRLDVALSNKTTRAMSGVLEMNVPAHFASKTRRPRRSAWKQAKQKSSPWNTALGTLTMPDKCWVFVFAHPKHSMNHYEKHQCPRWTGAFPPAR